MSTVKGLEITEFGSAVLRKKTRVLSAQEITSSTVQTLISDMESLLTTKKLGVGLAAPQVGEPIALAIIRIQKTAVRPDVEPFNLTIINPTISAVFGRKSQMWEGCISGGAGKAGLLAKEPRYKKIEIEFYDEKAVKHTQIFEGLAAHVIQHEVDHLNGTLFVDKDKDTKTYMTFKEYRNMKRKAVK